MSKKQNKSFVFIQHVPPYRHDILVAVGASVGQVKRFVKRNVIKDVREEFIKFAEHHKELFENIQQNKMNGYACYKKEQDLLLLIIPTLKDEWWYWESLVHEISHLMDHLVDIKMLDGETEARAYLHEYLFREMRIRIQKK